MAVAGRSVRADPFSGHLCPFRGRRGDLQKALWSDPGRLKDWRRIATCDDRCATKFFGAITLAATVSSGSANEP